MMLANVFIIRDVLGALSIMFLVNLSVTVYYLSEKKKAVPKWTPINIDHWVIPRQNKNFDREGFLRWWTTK